MSSTCSCRPSGIGSSKYNPCLAWKPLYEDPLKIYYFALRGLEKNINLSASLADSPFHSQTAKRELRGAGIEARALFETRCIYL